MTEKHFQASRIILYGFACLGVLVAVPWLATLTLPSTLFIEYSKNEPVKNEYLSGEVIHLETFSTLHRPNRRKYHEALYCNQRDGRGYAFVGDQTTYSNETKYLGLIDRVGGYVYRGGKPAARSRCRITSTTYIYLGPFAVLASEPHWTKTFIVSPDNLMNERCINPAPVPFKPIYQIRNLL